jgi:uncharacterized protein YvpB
MGMVLDSLGYENPTNSQYGDYLYGIAKSLGYDGDDVGDSRVLQEIFSKATDGQDTINRQLVSDSQRSEISQNDFIKQQLDKGNPVIVSTDAYGNPGSGHIMVAVGYDKTGWIMYDPMGDRNSGAYYPNKNGTGVHYDYNNFGIGDKYVLYLP